MSEVVRRERRQQIESRGAPENISENVVNRVTPHDETNQLD